MGRCFSVWIHLTNKWMAKAKAVIEHTLPLSIQTWKLTLTSRLAEFLNNPVPKDSKTSIAFRITLQSESRIFQQIIIYVPLSKHHTKSQGFHGCTLQAVISTQQTQYRNTGTPPGKPTKNWISPTGKGNSLNPTKKNITSSVSPLLGMYFETSSSQWETNRDVTSEKKRTLTSSDTKISKVRRRLACAISTWWFWHHAVMKDQFTTYTFGDLKKYQFDANYIVHTLGLSSKRILPIPGQS